MNQPTLDVRSTCLLFACESHRREDSTIFSMVDVALTFSLILSYLTVSCLVCHQIRYFHFNNIEITFLLSERKTFLLKREKIEAQDGETMAKNYTIHTL